VLVGAGDIADCTAQGAELTARLLDGIIGTVFTAGDNAYPHGSFRDYAQCYHPTWGRHFTRTFPSPGNHEYETPHGADYFNYFGDQAGPPSVGYYSFMVGQWLVLSLNSNVDAGPASAQAAWVRAALQQFVGPCVAAIWHHPVVSSGQNGPQRQMLDIWRMLQVAGADVVIAGHEHLYERYGHLDAQLQPTPRGIRQFVVGTGGTHLTRVVAVKPGSEVQSSTWGVLKLTLRPESYEWEFVPAEGSTFRDRGQDSCRPRV
jgi:hypothetical protein